jgi:predicted ArsR family transcriptional regulator
MANAQLVTQIRRAEELDLPLNRDIFTRTLIRELAGALEEVVGLKEAAGFVSVVGQNIGNQMNADYKAAFGANTLSKEQVRDVLVDLKRRIQGDFFIIEDSEDKIVLGNRICPFEEKVQGRQSMCMMTSNVFGSIAAENLGYAKVELQETIAAGDGRCRVVVYLRPGTEADAVEGREYFKSLE